MKLTVEGIKAGQAWEAVGVSLPGYNIEAVREKTKETPAWIHFGAGNSFRGFIGGIADTLIGKGELSTGIIAADTFDGEIIDKIYEPFDNLTLSVGLKPDGNSVKRVTAGIAGAIKADNEHLAELHRIASKGLPQDDIIYHHRKGLRLHGYLWKYPSFCGDRYSQRTRGSYYCNGCCNFNASGKV